MQDVQLLDRLLVDPRLVGKPRDVFQVWRDILDSNRSVELTQAQRSWALGVYCDLNSPIELDEPTHNYEAEWEVLYGRA